MTAVEFLWDNLKKGEFINNPDELLKQAIKMDYEQKFNAWKEGKIYGEDGEDSRYLNFNDYYNSTFDTPNF